MPTREVRGARCEARPWWVSVLLRLYPRDYRDRHHDELATAVMACLGRERVAGASPIVTSLRLSVDALVSSHLIRRDGKRISRLRQGYGGQAHLAPRNSG